MFLVNGVMLQGAIAAYDLFCMLLERDGYVQLAYKHAVSTIQPAAPVDLTGEATAELYHRTQAKLRAARGRWCCAPIFAARRTNSTRRNGLPRRAAWRSLSGS